VILVAAPFAWPDIPALTDNPGHMGRYRIALDLTTSEHLRRFYSFEWMRLARTGHPRLRAALFVPITLAIWLAHPIAWGMFGLLAFAAEFARQTARGRRPDRPFPHPARHGLLRRPLAGPPDARRQKAMFSHMTIGSNDIPRAKIFYDALFAAIGGKPGSTDPKGRAIYVHNGAILLVTTPIDGNTATVGNGGTIGFGMTSPAMADAWHKAGVENGGTAIEDAPGVRSGGAMPLYLAYLRDPDGNKLCALHRMPAA